MTKGQEKFEVAISLKYVGLFYHILDDEQHYYTRRGYLNKAYLVAAIKNKSLAEANEVNDVLMTLNAEELNLANECCKKHLVAYEDRSEPIDEEWQYAYDWLVDATNIEQRRKYPKYNL